MNRGLNFAEQFEHALIEDPQFIFITGWNEWIAGRHPEFAGIRLPVMFVDQFDQEHSRDIEPMRGGHGDHYYYQMTSFIRRYKGVRPVPKAFGPAAIKLEESFDQWNRVAPEFRDDIGDTYHRGFAGYAGHTNYVNTSGRNDIVVAKAAFDHDHVYFYARTREPLTPPSDGRWMRLLIDADANPQTGWEGYDLLVNRVPPTARAAVLERSAGDAWEWTSESTIPMRARAHELHLAIPRKYFPSTPLRLNFKWADNTPDNGGIVSWLDAGDTAPNGRFNYQLVVHREQAP